MCVCVCVSLFPVYMNTLHLYVRESLGEAKKVIGYMRGIKIPFDAAGRLSCLVCVKWQLLENRALTLIFNSTSLLH